MLPPFHGKNISEFHMFTVYLLTLNANVEDTLTSTRLFPTLISSISSFSPNSKMLLLDSLSNLVKNHSSLEKFFTIGDLQSLADQFKLYDYSSQAKLLDILDSFLDEEESADSEWILFICEDHIDCAKDSQDHPGGPDADLKGSHAPAQSKVTQGTILSQISTSNRQSGARDHVQVLQRAIERSEIGMHGRTSQLFSRTQMVPLMTASLLDPDASKSSSNFLLTRPDNDFSRAYQSNLNLCNKRRRPNPNEVQYCEHCRVSQNCKSVFAVNKKLVEDVFSKKREADFEKFFGKDFATYKLTKGFSTISVGTFRVSTFNLAHSVFTKMDRFVFDFLNRQRPLDDAPSLISRSVSPRRKERFSNLFDQEIHSINSHDGTVTEDFQINNNVPNFKKEFSLNFSISELKKDKLYANPKQRFSVSSQIYQEQVERMRKRPSEVVLKLIEKKLPIIKEKEGSELYGSGSESSFNMNKSPSHELDWPARSDDPARELILKNFMVYTPEKCTCRDITSLKSILHRSSDSEGDCKSAGMSPDSEKQIHLKDKLQSFRSIFSLLVTHQNPFDMNVFVLILGKFVRIFFTQSQPLKLFKMLASQVV